MGIFRQLQTDFWDDEDILDNFTPEDRYFYLCLLTNPRTKQCGIYKITMKQLSLYTGYSEESLKSLLDRFVNIHKKIQYNPTTKEIAIKNWLKFNNNRSENTQKCIQKEFVEVEDRSLIDYVKQVLSPLQAPHNLPCKEEEEEEEEEKKEKDIASTEYFQLTEIFFNDLIALVNPSRYKTNKPDLVEWSQHIRLLHERDKIEYKNMRDVWRWAMEDDFWKANILSTDKFRKQFDKLKIQSEKKNKQNGQTNEVPFGAITRKENT